jgi:hypothetical protein
MTYALPTQITLAQFERIDGLRNAARRDLNRRSHVHGQPILPLVNEAQHQSRLFDALIEVLGYSVACEIGVLEDYADDFITACLVGKIETLDVEAA